MKIWTAGLIGAVYLLQQGGLRLLLLIMTNQGLKKENIIKNIYVLDKDKGTLISAKDIPAAPLFEITTIRNGPNYSEGWRVFVCDDQ